MGGQTGLLRFPLAIPSTIGSPANPAASGPVIYYRDPDGKPLYALAPENHRRRARPTLPSMPART